MIRKTAQGHRSEGPTFALALLFSHAMKPIHCSLLIFGLTVSSVLDSASEQRNLDVAELWSGVEAIVSAARVAGLTAEPFDKFRVPGVTDTDDPDTTEDILLEAGFRRALRLVLRLRPGGLLWMAPVCSSWNFHKSQKYDENQGPGSKVPRKSEVSPSPARQPHG